MTEEQFKEIKEVYLKSITDFMQDETGMEPHITVFAERLDDEESTPAILHMPIPSSLMNSEDGKDKLIEVILPQVAKKIKKEFKPYGIAWTSEAWVRKTHKDNIDNDILLDNWKEIPISKEILMINIESEFGNEMTIYEIKRNGMEVTEDGLKDTVELILDKELTDETGSMTGRFTGLYNKFIKTHG
jgi:hypothetical protein